MPGPEAELHTAAKKGDVAELGRLLKSGHSVNEKSVRTKPSTRRLTRTAPLRGPAPPRCRAIAGC